MKVSAYDRLVMLNFILPKEGDLKTLILSKDIRKKIEIKQEEIDLIFEKDDKGRTSNLKIKEANELEMEIELSNSEKVLLKDMINDLDGKKKITSDIIDLCLKIKDL